jgi:hypothetical protein
MSAFHYNLICFGRGVYLYYNETLVCGYFRDKIWAWVGSAHRFVKPAHEFILLGSRKDPRNSLGSTDRTLGSRGSTVRRQRHLPSTSAGSPPPTPSSSVPTALSSADANPVVVRAHSDSFLIVLELHFTWCPAHVESLLCIISCRLYRISKHCMFVCSGWMADAPCFQIDPSCTK